MDHSSFHAGASKVDITPPLGTVINGDFVPHYARFIHDPLYAKALVMQGNGVAVAIVVVDICVMPKGFLDGVKQEILGKTGIEPANILISSTHTHAAGSVASAYLSAPDLQYMLKLPALIVKAVQEAKLKLRPAKTAFGFVDVPEHVLCRRYFMKEGYQARNPVTGNTDEVKTNPFGGEDQILRSAAQTDPQVGFLAVKGTDNKWISLLANYSLHYVGDWDNGTITADYFGTFSASIGASLNAGDDFVGIMSNGTSGNINIWDFSSSGRYPSQNFEKSLLIGNDIARKVFEAVRELEWDTDPSLSVQYEEVSVRIRKPSLGELEEAKAIVTSGDYESLRVDEEGLRSIYAREQVLLYEWPDALLFPVQALKVGDGAIGGLGGEIFAETGLWLKSNSAVKKYFTIGLANANSGYMPPAHEIERGGYETWRSRTSKLEAGAEEMIRNKQLQLIGKLAGIS